MEITFQVLDVDYILLNNKPVVRMFGKTKTGKTVCTFFRGFLPYFYVKAKEKQKVIEFLKEKYPNLVIAVREVERFHPIGYQPNKMKLLKIVLSDPSKTPSVRTSLQKESFVEKIFEADILFKYRFMADYNLHGMKWVRVIGNPTVTNTVKVDRTIEASSILEVDKPGNAPFKYMSIDIETDSPGKPDPKSDKVIMIGLAFYPDFRGRKSLVLVSRPISRKGTKGFKNEKEMLEEFVKVIESFDPDILTGYNINDFDLPFLFERLIRNNLSCTIGRCKQKHAISRKIGARYRNNIVGRVVVDVYELIKESIGKGLLRLKRYGLGDVSKELLGEDKIDITHSEISKFWNGNREQVIKLVEYNRRDAELALKLLLHKSLLDKFIELSKVCGLLLQDVLDGGEAPRVENLLLREFNKYGFVLPLKPDEQQMLKRREERLTKSLKGALVLEPKVGLHTDYVVYLDFKSMYPTIFIAFNICSTTLCLDKHYKDVVKTPYGTRFVSPKVRVGVIPRTIKKLISERDRIKQQMKKTTNQAERALLNAKQLALKYMTNAFYGYTGYIRGRIYVLDIANAITSCGRHFISETKRLVETDKRFTVIYGDTDSIMVKTNATSAEEAFSLGESLEKKINEQLKGYVQMKIESVFKSLLILSKKRYAGLALEKVNGEWTEKMVMKGIETVRRDWCDLTGKTLLNVLQIILKEQNPRKALLYTREIINKLAKNQIPIEELIITKGISKPLHEYKGIQPHVELVKKLRKRSPAEAPGIGDRVSFVIVQGPQLLSQRAEDPEYVKKHGLKIDSKYYIEGQILPPLERVFSATGITKSELTGFGKQLLLTDLMKTKSKKREQEIVLNSVEGFICSKCNKIYRRPPLIGRCENCSGNLLFYSNGIKSRFLAS